MHATKAAVEEGIVAGGGVALLRAANGLRDARRSTATSSSASTSSSGPSKSRMRWIATNAGHEGAIVVQRVKDMKGDEGFNAQTEQYENLVKAGVIDPAKVVRSALQNAASIASLLLTTEAVISQRPEEKTGGRGARGRRNGRRDVLRNGSPAGAARDRSPAGAGVLLPAPEGRLRTRRRSAGTALQRQRAGALRAGVHARRVRAVGAGEPQRRLRSFRLRHDARARQR